MPRTPKSPSFALVLLLALVPAASGDTAGSAPPPGAPDAALVKAKRKLVESARETDPVKARALAADALPALRAAFEKDPKSCEAVILLAEAQLRVQDAAGALKTLDASSPTQCDPVAYFQLYGWALEFDASGVRRGPSAPLENAEQAFQQAALAAATSDPPLHETMANALLRAAELAELRGDRERCRIHCLRALKAPLPRPDTLRVALQFLRCAGPSVGEGTAFDRLSLNIDESLFYDLADLRLKELKQRLDKGHDDAAALTAVAYYALLTHDPIEDRNALHYLVEAAALDEKQPELWYLMGRANERTGRLEEAADNYRRQIKEHPGGHAARLAVNDLAHLLATSGAPRESLEEALRLLDAEIAKTPKEAAMHDTRARVLLALGRRDEAKKAWERALAEGPDPVIEHELEKLERGPSAAPPGRAPAPGR